MSVTVPVTVKKFRDVERDFGTTAAQALWQRAAQIVQYIAASQPIGRLMWFHGTQPGLPFTPDTRYWKKMDGTMIVNANSPLNGVMTIDLRDKLIRHPAFSESDGSTGGTDTINLAHSHGGFTAYEDDRAVFEMDNGEERTEANVHRHSLSVALGIVNVVPSHRMLEIWVRIV